MNQATYVILQLINILLSIYIWVIIGNAILSWFLPAGNTLRQFLEFLSAPVVNPFRRLMSRFTSRSAIPIDISPMLAIFTIYLVRLLINAVFSWAF